MIAPSGLLLVAMSVGMVASLALLADSAGAEVVVYPAPEGVELSKDYQVTVNGRPVAVYTSPTWEPPYAPRFGGPYAFAYFDLTGEAEVTVTTDKPLNKLVIRPESRGVKPTVNGKTFTFSVAGPCQLSIEPDAKFGPLLLFVNPPETDRPSPDDPNVRYFGPGLHEAGAIELTSGQTLYLAGGAVVRGGVQARGEDIRICGRGIIDGLTYERFKGPTGSPVLVLNSRRVTVEGIILKDAWSWTCHVRGSRGVDIRNVKIVSARCENNDGIDLVNTSDVTIRDCFIRSDDDCIAIKGMTAERQPCENITVTGSVLWSDRANVWRLGCESRAEGMRNFIFRDIDVVHYCTGYDQRGAPVCITVQPAEDMTMENVLFEDIRIHNEPRETVSGSPMPMNYLVEIRPLPTIWAKTQTPGTARNIIFRDITITGRVAGQSPPRILIEGADDQHQVENVLFENVRCFGKPITEKSSEVKLMGHARNLLFR